jgi:predicted metal-dependent phosphoesterase TrpH
MLAAAGVRCAALTDHDTSRGLVRFRAGLHRHGIAFVSGIELTASHPVGEVHLLALGFPLPGPNAIEGSLRASPRIRSGYTSFLRGREAESVERAESLIHRMHQAGALVYLAHPLQPAGDLSRLESLLGDLRLAGLDGIEALYKPYPREERSRLARLAGRHGLLVVGGSDFHGDGVLGSPEPGCEMPRWHWERLRQALSIPPLDPAEPEENL